MLSITNIGKALRAALSVSFVAVLVQALSFVANLIVIRFLSISDYALLTSSLSILGVMGAIADAGVSQAALTVGGRHYSNPEARAFILQQCRRFIYKTAALSGLIIIPIWSALTLRLAVPPSSIIPTGFVLFGGFTVTIGLSIFRTYLLLEQKRNVVQVWDVAKTAARLLLLVSGISLFPSASYVLICGVLVEFASYIGFRSLLKPLLTANPIAMPSILAEIRAVYFRVLPSALYKAISSQVFLLLLIFFGRVASVAGAGVLGKFQQVFIFVPSIVYFLLSPTLANCHDRTKKRRLLLSFSLIATIAGFSICFMLIVLAKPILALYGQQYIQLVPEMRIFMVASALTASAGAVLSLVNSYGWVMPPQLLISSDLIFTAAAIASCDVSNLHGFVSMSLTLNAGALATVVGWYLYCIVAKVPDSLAATEGQSIV